MPQGSKQRYTSKQKRQAEHIEESAKQSGKSSARAKQIAWATVNKQDGGGKKSGSGRGKPRDTTPSKRGGRKAATTRTRSATPKRATATKARRTTRGTAAAKRSTSKSTSRTRRRTTTPRKRTTKATGAPKRKRRTA